MVKEIDIRINRVGRGMARPFPVDPRPDADEHDDPKLGKSPVEEVLRLAKKYAQIHLLQIQQSGHSGY